MITYRQPRPAIATCRPGPAVWYCITEPLPPGVDFVAVERAVNGIPTPLTPLEQYEAAKILHAVGHGTWTIAARTAASRADVQRWQDRQWPTKRPPDPTRKK